VASDFGRRWVHIGDDFPEDMTGAKKVKVRTLWYRTPERKAVAEQKEGDRRKRLSLDGPPQSRPGERWSPSSGAIKVGRVGRAPVLSAQPVVLRCISWAVSHGTGTISHLNILNKYQRLCVRPSEYVREPVRRSEAALRDWLTSALPLLPGACR
jgi:hypothetical protein